MITSLLAGKFMDIIKCDKETIPKIIKEIISNHSRSTNGLRLDIYGSSDNMLTLLVDYLNEYVIIVKHDGTHLSELSSNMYESLAKLLDEIIDDRCYIEVYSLSPNEIDLNLNVINERAVKDGSIHPYYQVSLEKILAITTGEQTSGFEEPGSPGKASNEEHIYSRLKDIIDEEYSKLLVSPSTIARILAFSRDYDIKELAKEEIKTYKYFNIIEDFVKSANVWAMLLKFDDYEVWAVKKDDSIGMIAKYMGGRTYTGSETVKIIEEELHNNIDKIDKIRVVLYYR
ncbi:MAG: hypothetical protein GXO43_09345 [Crenarchaeota archaeon]|nr:hypothetical protein [Thermoproteota archaeon]